LHLMARLTARLSGKLRMWRRSPLTVWLVGQSMAQPTVQRSVWIAVTVVGGAHGDAAESNR
jgi:hypothetical protein